MNRLIFLLGLCISAMAHAQESLYLQQYRMRVVNYNHDMKAAEYVLSVKEEMAKSAKADFLPKLSADGNFNYTGNPRELTVNIPDMNSSLSFQGREANYNASLTLAQPIYAGGAIKARYEKAQKEKEVAYYDKQRIYQNMLYNADVYYWNVVASEEMVDLAMEYKESVARLVDVVKHRVEVEYTDRNDLLMAEVKLNDATYKLTQSQNNSETARLALNAYSGVSSSEKILTDETVIPLKQAEPSFMYTDEIMMNRPEVKMASTQVDIRRSESRIANSQYLPCLSVGIDGGYYSPGYDFRPDWDPNYSLYAKLSIPIFEWGKRKSTRKAGIYGIHSAEEEKGKIVDQVRLEMETACYDYSQAVEKVRLTESSLEKAEDSETLAMDKYREGTISIVEVINAQLYHYEAKVNYIQSKLNAQIAKSNLDRAFGQFLIK